MRERCCVFDISSHQCTCVLRLLFCQDWCSSNNQAQIFSSWSHSSSEKSMGMSAAVRNSEKTAPCRATTYHPTPHNTTFGGSLCSMIGWLKGARVWGLDIRDLLAAPSRCTQHPHTPLPPPTALSPFPPTPSCWSVPVGAKHDAVHRDVKREILLYNQEALKLHVRFICPLQIAMCFCTSNRDPAPSRIPTSTYAETEEAVAPEDGSVMGADQVMRPKGKVEVPVMIDGQEGFVELDEEDWEGIEVAGIYDLGMAQEEEEDFELDGDEGQLAVEYVRDAEVDEENESVGADEEGVSQLDLAEDLENTGIDQDGVAVQLQEDVEGEDGDEHGVAAQQEEDVGHEDAQEEEDYFEMENGMEVRYVEDSDEEWDWNEDAKVEAYPKGSIEDDPDNGWEVFGWTTGKQKGIKRSMRERERLFVRRPSADARMAAFAERDDEIARQNLKQRNKLPLLAVVGRPNVGKSTIVNRICGVGQDVCLVYCLGLCRCLPPC